MNVRRFFRPTLASAVAAATLVAYTGLSVPIRPAQAQDDQPTLDVIQGLNSTFAFLDSLSQVGALAQPLPALGLAPGGPDGLAMADLLQQARDELLGGTTFGGVNGLNALVEAIDDAGVDLADGRDVDFSAVRTTEGDLSRITIGVTAERTVQTGLDVVDSSPAFSFTAADGVQASLQLTGSFVILYDESERTFQIERTASSPSLAVTAEASIPTLSAVSAGLGILEVQLGEGSFLDVDATLTASFADPDNDGVLAFVEPDGAGGTRPGELDAAGAGAGLAGVTLTAGSLDALLDISAVPSDLIPGLDASASAQVTVSSTDLTTTPPQVHFDAGALDAVNAFLNLSPRDLAQGLAEIATSLVAMQRAGGIDLPFLRGDLTDAVMTAEAIVEFLEANVDASDDPATPGRPDFASLQQLLQMLVDADALPSGADFTVTDGSYDGEKVRFSLGISRTAGPEEPLNELGTATSSDGTGVTFGATTLTDPGQNFSDGEGEALSYIGRQVLAGSSSAVVLSASGDTLTLDTTATGNPALAWQGGEPADGTPYSISAGDPRTGLVELGNVLGDDGAILNANAKTAVAKVSPSYQVTLPIVLDLRAADTEDCDPDPDATAPCPFQFTDPDTGLATVITSLPLAPDRIKLHTGQPLLTADAPISTKVEVDATVGFVGVKITGDLRMCTAGSPTDCSTNSTDSNHLFSLGLQPLGDEDDDATLPEIGAALVEALDGDGVDDGLASVIDAEVQGQAYAALTVDVPGANGFFGGSPAEATITLADIRNPAAADVTAPELSKLVPLNFDPDNPLALLGVLLADLQAVQSMLSSIPGAGDALETEIPLVGRSLSDLIGSGVSGGGEGVEFTATTLTDPTKSFDNSFIGRRVAVGTTTAVVLGGDGDTLTVTPWNVVPAAGSEYAVDSEIQGVVNLLTAAPPANLQQALDLLRNALGLDSGVGFTVDTSDPAAPVLELDVEWDRSVEKTLPVNLQFDLGGAEKALVGADVGGVLDVTVGGGIDLGLSIPLTEAAAAAPLSALKLDPTSSIDARATLTGTGLTLATNLGPFQLSLGDPATPDAPGTQLEADFGVSLALPAPVPTEPVTLQQFAEGVGVQLDNGEVECAGAPSDEPLAACAVLPIYLNGSPISATDNAFLLRLPTNATDLADAFNPSGPDIGSNPRFFAPPELATKLAEAGLNLLTLGDGLFAYIEFLENALQVASADGKLPLIGKDLQAGSKFLEDLRVGLESAFAGAGVPTEATVGAVRDFLNDQVAQHLPGVTTPLPIQFECEVFLDTAAAPDVAATNDGVTTTTYEYKVVAAVNDPLEDGIPSDASTPVQNAATLDATHFNTVTWEEVTNADAYRILRRTGGAGDYLLVDTVEADQPRSFKDEGASESAYVAQDANPKVVPCPDSSDASEITGFSVIAELGEGDPSTADGCTTDCREARVPLDLGIPGLSFKASDAADDKIVAKVGWSLYLEFGLNREDGFFVRTQTGPEGATQSLPEFTLGASLDLPANMQAQLAFFDIDIAKHAGTTTPLLKGAFSIDLKDDPTTADCHGGCTVDSGRILTLDTLRSSSLSDLVDPRLTAGVLIDWDVTAQVNSALPGIAARFVLQWDWNSDAPDSFGPENLKQLAFKNVSIDPGQFIDKNLGPIVKQIIDVYKPVQPILDTILAPLPVLSDLSKLAGGDDVTIATLADTFSTLAGGPDLTPFIEVLTTIRTIGKAFTGSCTSGGSFCVSLGDFDVKKELALTTANSAATAASLVEPTGPTVTNPLDQLDANSDADLRGSEGPTLPGAACPNGKRGISFPALENPTSMFGLLLNQDVELACFDSGPLALGFEMNLRLGPVYAPPPVYIVISGGASVSLRIAAGFDTYGIRTAVESGKVTVGILDSIYFKTTDTTGAPLPVVQFKGFLAAGASVSAVVIEVGVKGGIELTVQFTWNDPNNDGKFRFNEFLATALNNPICLFNVGGQLDLFISVFITLGIDPFSVSFDFELVRVKLLDFSLKPNCEPPPPRLGGVDENGTLYLFAGSFGGSSERGDAAWDNEGKADEGWVIRQVADDPETTDEDEAAVVVQALGITETFPDAGGDAIQAVVLDGRGYDGELKVLFNGGSQTSPFDKDTVVFTGDKDDTVRTGSGSSWVDGGAGKDNLSTTDRPALDVPVEEAGTATVAGGTGIDSITVGNGANFVHGDSALSFQTGTVEVTPLTGAAFSLSGAILAGTVGEPTDKAATTTVDGGDTVSAGLGGSEIWGGAGDDILGTANDSPLAEVSGNAGTAELYRAQPNEIVGGPGNDRIKSGSADDTIWTGDQVNIGVDDAGSGDLDGASNPFTNTVDTGTGSDTVYGSDGKDNVATGSTTSQSAKVYGGAASDILTGGAGTDELYGGPGDDYVIAEPATVDTANPVSDELGQAHRVVRLPLPSSPSAKTLAGGGGSDRIYGGDGTTLIYGDRADFTCGQPVNDPLSDEPTESPTATGDPAVDDADDLILGGEGVDTVNAGGGNDVVAAKGAADLLCGNAGNDKIAAGAGDDHVWSGSGDDTAFGDAGVDHVFGNPGADTLYGGGGTDTIEGNDGTDTAFGGFDKDVVVGGTRAAGRVDQGDSLYGDLSEDVLIGDNGTPEELFDLASGDATLGGRDVLRGGDGDDAGYGGLDNDTLYGGEGDDQLEGNPATDTVYGEGGADNIIGGTSQLDGGTASYPDAGDVLEGGPLDDVIAGDNAVLTSVDTGGTAITTGRGLTFERTVLLHDLGHGPDATKSGQDTLRGGAESDVLLGQGDVDTVHGDAGDDYAEGGQDADTVSGGGGEDDLVGGGHVVHEGAEQERVGQLDAGDTISGGPGADVALGDNGQLLRGTAETSPITQGRGMTERLIELYDLGSTPVTGTSGADLVQGDAGTDVLLGQSDADRIQGGTHDDHVEGGPAGDWIEGGSGDDDQVGGSSTILGEDTGVTTVGQPDGADVVFGGEGDDLQLGDNASVSRVGDTNPLTVRLAAPGDRVDERQLRLYDLSQGGELAELETPPASRFGGDHLSGGQGVDIQLGQDGDEQVFGGSEDDYQEGNGGTDTLYGDRVLTAVVDVELLDVDAFPGTRGSDLDLEGVQGSAGQDDQVGGSSRRLHRDQGDVEFGDGAADFQLGDNGQLLRSILEGDVYAFYVDYNATTVVRQSDRYDVGFGDGTSLPYGDDEINGNDGDDYQWGQDGNDLMHGNAQNDDMHGELGDDEMFGDEGEDAMIGDRGVITDTLVTGDGPGVTSDTQGPGFFVYEGLRPGQLDRRVDLSQDGDGDVNGKGVVEAPGLTHGGNDTMRGGPDHDSMHGAFGDDLMNGDSGGDWLFGAEGVDVMWGGQGKPVSPLDPTANERTEEGSTYFDSYVDYLFGGASGAEDLQNRYGVTAGADVLDWRPRGTYAACELVTEVSETCDPGDWFRITDTHDADVANNQHHSGIDWIYGGEGRDVMQGDVGKNGPDFGDRLLDWNGAFNLYTRCNASYGDDGDIRQHSPAIEEFLHRLAFGSGAGASVEDVYAMGTSGERELAFAQRGERGNAGPAFPGTPGHFNTPACSP